MNVLYKPKPLPEGWGDFKKVNAIMKENWDQIIIQDNTGRDNTGRDNNTLVGRYIAEPQGDGQAIYQIIKDNKNTVRIKLCRNIGDDWSISYWGEEATIDKEFAIQSIGFRDHMNALVGGKK